MTTLVVGATGATGRLLIEQLLDLGQRVRAVVRSPEKLPDAVTANPNLELTVGSVLELPDPEIAKLVDGCDAIASCLGHNLTIKGLFGQPRRLVTDTTRRLCQTIAANKPNTPVKFVLMNTAGNRNRDLAERVSIPHRAVIALLRLGLPPHADNEAAADYLRTHFSPDHTAIEWSVVRPDTLTDQDRPTPYTLHPSPARCAIFNPGKTARINVAHFMADLITNPHQWETWRSRMPVIYNQATPDTNNRSDE